MSIPDHARANFQTLLRAAADGNLALMECIDAVTGEPRYVICAVGRGGTHFLFTPFGHLADGNPFDAYCRRPGPRRTDRPPDPPFSACLGAAVRGSTGKPFPHRLTPMRDPRSLNRARSPARRSGIRRRRRCARFSTSMKSGVPAVAVYIGRGNKWGNPFRIGADGDRATVSRNMRLAARSASSASGSRRVAGLRSRLLLRAAPLSWRSAAVARGRHTRRTDRVVARSRRISGRAVRRGRGRPGRV